MPGTNHRTPVLLLKTKSQPYDGYEEYFKKEQNGQFEPKFVPVLEHRFNNVALGNLKDSILRGDFGSSKGASEPSQYGGLIFTSQRAVEAFTEVLNGLRQADEPIDKILPRSLYLYVVGPATARGLNSIGLQCAVVGEESGNGEALASFILDHYNNKIAHPSSLHFPKPALLFLVGEQRRDIIPKTLQSDSLAESNRIRVEELTVYETDVMESFPQDFKLAVAPALERQSLQWIIVFSPTGCKVMLECLGILDEASGKVKAEASRVLTRIGTIGPTTRDFLRREFDLEPDVCASNPSPDGIGKAIAIAEFGQN